MHEPVQAASDANPYAAPQVVEDALLPEEEPVAAWRDGDLLVVPREGMLPGRCVQCNAPAEGKRMMLVRSERKLLDLLGILAMGLLMVGLMGLRLKLNLPWPIGVRDSIFLIMVTSPLLTDLLRFWYGRMNLLVAACRRHRQLRTLHSTAGWISYIGFFLLYFAFEDWFLTVALIAFLPAFAVVSLTHRMTLLLQVKRESVSLVWLKGAGKRFLESLPPLDEGRNSEPEEVAIASGGTG